MTASRRSLRLSASTGGGKTGGGGLDGEVAVIAGGAGLLLLAAGTAVALHGPEETLNSANALVASFNALVASLGTGGRVLYVVTYASVELFLLPATPLALTAGALFGLWPGFLLSSIGGLGGATGAFLLSRYLLRERVLSFTRDQEQLSMIDRAIERNGFKVVLLVNLSPLVRFSSPHASLHIC